MPANPPRIVELFNEEKEMKRLAALALMSTCTLAFAHNCPNEMKAIDAKLGATSGLSAENMAKVKQLRADGEKYHKAGKHDESMKSLKEAKDLLGI
jgi:hypothetical protein